MITHPDYPATREPIHRGDMVSFYTTTPDPSPVLALRVQRRALLR